MKTNTNIQFINAFQAATIDACILAGKDFDEFGPVLTPEEERELEKVIKKEENAMNVSVETIVTAAGIYCQGIISHKEIIGGKLLLGCQGAYESDEIIVISLDGKVVMSHPFSDKEDVDISQNFWEIVKNLEEVQELEGTAALRRLAETWDSMGYLGFIGVEEAGLYVDEAILFAKLYPMYGESLYELRDTCMGHGEDSHIHSGEDDINIIVDNFIYESPLWASAIEALEEQLALG